MIIKDCRGEPPTFGNIGVGDVFCKEWPSAFKEYYMKIETLAREDQYKNAIDLTSGTAWHFYDDTKVELVSAEVVIR